MSVPATFLRFFKRTKPRGMAAEMLRQLPSRVWRALRSARAVGGCSCSHGRLFHLDAAADRVLVLVLPDGTAADVSAPLRETRQRAEAAHGADNLRLFDLSTGGRHGPSLASVFPDRIPGAAYNACRQGTLPPPIEGLLAHCSRVCDWLAAEPTHVAILAVDRPVGALIAICVAACVAPPWQTAVLAAASAQAARAIEARFAHEMHARLRKRIGRLRRDTAPRDHTAFLARWLSHFAHPQPAARLREVASEPRFLANVVVRHVPSQTKLGGELCRPFVLLMHERTGRVISSLNFYPPGPPGQPGQMVQLPPTAAAGSGRVVIPLNISLQGDYLVRLYHYPGSNQENQNAGAGDGAADAQNVKLLASFAIHTAMIPAPREAGAGQPLNEGPAIVAATFVAQARDTIPGAAGLLPEDFSIALEFCADGEAAQPDDVLPPLRRRRRLPVPPGANLRREGPDALAAAAIAAAAAAVAEGRENQPPHPGPTGNTRKIHFVEALPVENATERLAQTECAVCMEQYLPGARVKTLPCLHRFHASCADRWLLTRPVCPVCNSDVIRAAHEAAAYGFENIPCAAAEV
jgi:hypothetical protein